jgi:hypothetical protein
VSIEDRRRKLEREVEAAKAARALRAPGSFAGAGPAGAGPAGDVASPADIARCRALAVDKNAPSAQRTQALGDLMEADASGRETPTEALQVLGDPAEAPAMRLSAHGLLNAARFHAAAFPEWRPRYLDALRAASRAKDAKLRAAAFEALAYMKDKPAQQALIDGLTKPAKAPVAPEHALRLLSVDPHSGVQPVARRLADAPPNPAVQLEALRALASDPDSKQRFATLVTNAKQPTEARVLAATALNGLDPALLQQAAQNLAVRLGPIPAAGAPGDSADDRVLKHLAALLEKKK